MRAGRAIKQYSQIVSIQRQDTTVSPPVTRDIATNQEIYLVPLSVPEEIYFTGETVGEKKYHVRMVVKNTDVKEGDILNASDGKEYMIEEVNTFAQTQQMRVVER